MLKWLRLFHTNGNEVRNMIDNIDKLSKNYMRQGLYLTVALSLLTLLVMRVWFLDLLTAVLVSAAFTLVVCGAIGLIWRYVAKHSPDSLPTFLQQFQASACCWH